MRRARIRVASVCPLNFPPSAGPSAKTTTRYGRKTFRAKILGRGISDKGWGKVGLGGVGGGRGVDGWDGTGRTSDGIGAAGETSGETAPMDLSPGFLYFSSRTAPSELRRSPPPTLKKKRLLREDGSHFRDKKKDVSRDDRSLVQRKKKNDVSREDQSRFQDEKSDVSREDQSLFLHPTSLTSPSVPVVLPDHSVYDLETSEEKNI